MRRKPTPTGTKRCSFCGIVKPRSDFYPASRPRDGVGTYCKDCNREAQKQRYWRDREGHVKRSNERYRLAKYGLTQEAFEALWEASGGFSHLSGTRIVPGRHKKNSGCIDHYEDVNGLPVIRGLISQRENTALGLLDHDPELCIKAAEYLYRHQLDLRELCTI